MVSGGVRSQEFFVHQLSVVGVKREACGTMKHETERDKTRQIIGPWGDERRQESVACPIANRLALGYRWQ